MDYYNVTDGYNVFELQVLEGVKPISLMDLNSPAKFGVNIILIKRNHETFQPNKDYVIQPGDHIFIFGLEKGVFELEAYLESTAK